MTKLAVLMLTFAATVYAQFTPDDSTRLSFKIRAFSRSGERKIEARSIYLDTFSKKGQPMKRQLFVVFDPVSGYFLFAYAGHGSVEEAMESDKRPVLSDAQRTTVRSAAYISDRGILVASAVWSSVIGIAQSNEKAGSIGDAEQQAIRNLIANAIEATRIVEWPATKQVYLLGHDGRSLLGAEFSIPPLHVTPEPVSVIGIAESREGWKITLEGQYKARVTLSSDFQPLRAERIDPPKP